MKNKRICEISGFVMFPFFTYPLFLDVSDFTGLSDYVFYDFNNNPLAVKILFLRQPEKPYNQAALVFCSLVFHRSFILVVVLLVFVQFPKGHKSRCKRSCFTFHFAVFYNVICRVLEC